MKKFVFALLFMVLIAAFADARPRRVNSSISTTTRSAWSSTSNAQGTVTASSSSVTVTTSEAVEALAEVNARRARSGLRPFLHDPLLTEGAKRCAVERARRLLFGHLPSDFAYLPPGAKARAGGCAAYPPGMGWYSCCCEDNATYAGAAWAIGRDGRRYMHLFVR